MSKGLTKSETHNILQTLGHQPQKALGQNFLIDKNIVERSIHMASVSENDTVIEVGPGLGTLTRALHETGAQVFAVEKDKRLFAYLKDNLPTQINLLLEDALNKPLGNFNPEPNSNFKIVANLPYNVSTPWLEAVLNGPTLPASLTLMLQEDAAKRYMAQEKTKEYSPISILLQGAYNLTDKHKVAANCFYPAPNVSSSLIHLEKKQDPFRFKINTYQFIRKLFNHRRKQIGKTLKSDLSPNQLQQLETIPQIQPQLRAEDLPLAAWIEFDSLF